MHGGEHLKQNVTDAGFVDIQVFPFEIRKGEGSSSPNRIANLVDPQLSGPIVKVWQSSVAALSKVNGMKETFKDEKNYREFVEQVAKCLPFE